MDAGRYHALTESDGRRLAQAAAAAGPAAGVPTCPGWTVDDLLRHTAQVYEHKIVAIRLTGPRPEPWPPDWPAGVDPLAWFEDALARLLATLRSTPADAPSWTWWPADPTAGFWSRRMAHETAVHRADAESAMGEATELDRELGADGVDEVLTTMLAGDWSDDPQPGSTGTVAVCSGDRRWWVTMTPTTVVVGDGETSGTDATVTASPSDLDLWLWGRTSADVLRVEGDPAVVDRFRARLVAATQ